MTTFDERERAFENRYAHDQETRFRVLARRNHKIGLWAAQRLGRGGVQAEEDAQAFVAFAVEREGDAALVARLLQEFEQGGVAMSREELVHQFTAFLTDAQREIQSV